MRLRLGTHQLLALAVVVAVGFAAAWALLVGWTAQVVAQAGWLRQPWESLRIETDGTPLVVSYQGVRQQYRQYRDLAGHQVSVADESKFLNVAFLPAHLRLGVSAAEVPWSQRVRGFSDNRNPPVWWFAISDGRSPGSLYLVGYDSLSNGRVGFLGTAGFREQPLPPQERFPLSWSSQALLTRLASNQRTYPVTRFPYSNARAELKPGEVPGWAIHLLTDDNKVYALDLLARTVKTAFDEKPANGCALLDTPYTNPPGSTITRLAVRTDDEVLTLDSAGKVQKRWAVPAELRGQDLSWGETTSGEAVAYAVAWGDDLDPVTRYTLYRLNRAGDVAEKNDVNLNFAGAQLSMRVLLGVILPSPVEIDAVTWIQKPLEYIHGGRARGYVEGLQRAVTGYWPSLMIAHVVGLAFALLCYRRQKIYAASGVGLVLWPLFVFLCGLPGWIGYRYGRRWPSLERCPTCGAVVPQDRASCRACDVEFPMPEPKGTEVFA